MKFYKAWKYLENHVIFKDQYGWSQFKGCLDIDVVKVNPKTNSIDDNPELNTSTRVWLEAGPYIEKTPTHDISLDCGAKTFEKAIIKLAKLVKKRYGDNPEKAIKKVNKHFKAYKEEIENVNNQEEKEEYHQISLDEYSRQLEEKCKESNIVATETENVEEITETVKKESIAFEETSSVEKNREKQSSEVNTEQTMEESSSIENTTEKSTEQTTKLSTEETTEVTTIITETKETLNEE